MSTWAGSGHVPAIAYCSGFVPPDSIGGDDWMARFPFMKFQQDGLPFVINGLRWHSHNCARGHFVADTGSGVNGECENLNTRGRPAYSIIQRFVVTSRDNTYWKLTHRVCLAQCYKNAAVHGDELMDHHRCCHCHRHCHCHYHHRHHHHHHHG